MAFASTIDQDMLLAATWASFNAQVLAGNQQLVLPDNLPNPVIADIQSQYSVLTNGPVSVTPVAALNIILLAPYAGTASPTFTPSIGSPVSAPSPPQDSKGKAKVPRPPNAFILYRQHQHPVVKAKYPGIINNDISKRVAAMWKAEDIDVKAAWTAKAAEVKDEHMRQHPDYSYQPRKPSEKKRRMTKRKMANTPQGKLPKFSLATDNPMLLQYTLGNSPVAIQNVNQLVDRHNHSSTLTNDPAAPATISTDNFINVTSERELANAVALPTQPAVAAPAVRLTTQDNFEFEQDRQLFLGDDELVWSMFDVDAFSGY